MEKGILYKEDLVCDMCKEKNGLSQLFGIVIATLCLNEKCVMFRIMKMPLVLTRGATKPIHDSEIQSEN